MPDAEEPTIIRDMRARYNFVRFPDEAAIVDYVDALKEEIAELSNTLNSLEQDAIERSTLE